MLKDLDKLDRSLLRELQHDARISNAELAERIKLSPTPTLRRLRKLESSGLIKGYTALLDREALGLHTSAFVFIKLERNSTQNAEAFEQQIEKIPEVTGCWIVAGEHDYVLQIITGDLDDYERLVKEKLAGIKVVTHIESIIVLKQVLERNILPLT